MMLRVLAAAAGAVAVLVPPALADPAACQGGLRRESARFAKSARQAVEDCEERVLAGVLPAATDCATESGTILTLTVAAARARVRIAARCCGPDGACSTGDDESLSAVGWTSATCPNLENGTCTAPTPDAGEVADCITCAGTTAVDRVFELLDDRFAAAPAGSAVARCQGAINAASTRFYWKKAKTLRRCWDARARGRHANDCPLPGDGKAGPAIARAEQKMTERICRDCGGADGACGGGDDLTPGAIGFLANCPPLTPPGAASCAGPVGTLAELVSCAVCVSEFAVDCVDRLSVPAFATYPTECNPSRGTCNAGVECETSLDCPAGSTCEDNGSGTTRYCVDGSCTGDGDCSGGAVCRPYCTVGGCGPPRCQCPGFGCAGADEVCIDNGGLACRKICTQDSDCEGAFGGVCVNPGFGFGVCIGTEPCQ